VAEIASAHSAGSVVTAPLGGHWLKDPSDPTRTIPLFVTAGPAVKTTRRQGEHLPLGSTATVVVKDASPGSTTISLTLHLRHDGDRVAVLSRKNDGRTLLYQDSLGHQWYVEFRADDQWEPANYAAREMTMQVQFVKVAKP
jgi:hypothetical protein